MPDEGWKNLFSKNLLSKIRFRKRVFFHTGVMVGVSDPWASSVLASTDGAS